MRRFNVFSVSCSFSTALKVSKTSCHDPKSGLEVSSLGPLRLQWSDPPVLVDGIDDHVAGDILITIDGTSVVGLTQKEIRRVILQRQSFGFLSVGEIFAHYRVAPRKAVLLQHLKEHRYPVHCQAKCKGCLASPLVGFCFTCKTCPDLHYCAACFRGRGHSHASGHSFTKVEYPGAPAVDALPPPPLQADSAVVIVGTGEKDQDGEVGLILSMAASGWQVMLDGHDEPRTVLAEHLFLKVETKDEPKGGLPESKSPVQGLDKLEHPGAKDFLRSATPIRAERTSRCPKADCFAWIVAHATLCGMCSQRAAPSHSTG